MLVDLSVNQHKCFNTFTNFVGKVVQMKEIKEQFFLNEKNLFLFILHHA